MGLKWTARTAWRTERPGDEEDPAPPAHQQGDPMGDWAEQLVETVDHGEAPAWLAYQPGASPATRNMYKRLQAEQLGFAERQIRSSSRLLREARRRRRSAEVLYDLGQQFEILKVEKTTRGAGLGSEVTATDHTTACVLPLC